MLSATSYRIAAVVAEAVRSSYYLTWPQGGREVLPGWFGSSIVPSRSQSLSTFLRQHQQLMGAVSFPRCSNIKYLILTNWMQKREEGERRQPSCVFVCMCAHLFYQEGNVSPKPLNQFPLIAHQPGGNYLVWPGCVNLWAYGLHLPIADWNCIFLARRKWGWCWVGNNVCYIPSTFHGRWFSSHNTMLSSKTFVFYVF